MNPRLYRLLEKHQRIDEQLRMEQRRTFPDWVALLRLKRTKLRIKDVIHRFTRRAAQA
ncbi:YdcH family protein [Sphingomonas piscis]|uniref:YdcH family protein n=1 Tax=Sphingomonas piscis TaxID=2714943 RepID=A0A6G7YMA0_9SPHN|nr:YdcH family protein [Sphingomonas piscis]QIK77869.1 YdcH family protein [Sphingomonas piscis]